MTPRQRVVRALTFQPLDRAPRHPWALPGVLEDRRAEYERLLARFPSDLIGPGADYGPGRRARPPRRPGGPYVDAWGCAFEALEPGVIGEVKHPLLADDYAGLSEYRAPWELLEGLDAQAVARACAATDRFVLAGSQVRPFERMQFLRGTENLLVDLALDDPRAYELRDLLHEFYLADMRFWAATPVDGVSFMDDWGAQRALLISPAKWRQFFKPLYREYCDILRAAGKFVFFHSDGFIEEIYPDLIEVGVQAINSQLFCMNIEELGRKYAGQIAFWGEIDRQRILPFGSPEDARAAVRRVHGALCPDGVTRGVFAQCEWGNRDPSENVFAVYDEWERIGPGR